MNQEIDIIELLKRVKEGKAPKRIKIEGTKYEFYENYTDIVCAYQTKDYDNWLEEKEITLDTKIEILDKPIIEELEIRPSRNYKDINTDVLVYIDNEGKECENFYSVDVYIARKINEIIRHINEERK